MILLPVPIPGASPILVIVSMAGSLGFIGTIAVLMVLDWCREQRNR